MYTISKNGSWGKVEKKVIQKKKDDMVIITIAVSNTKGSTGVPMWTVSAFVAPFRGESRFMPLYFWGDARSAWNAFKNFQALLGGDFND